MTQGLNSYNFVGMKPLQLSPIINIYIYFLGEGEGEGREEREQLDIEFMLHRRVGTAHAGSVHMIVYPVPQKQSDLI